MKKLGTVAGFYVICFILIYVFLLALEVLSKHGAGILIVPVPLALLLWALYGLICRVDDLQKRIDELTGKAEDEPKA